jgi:sugar diacid utilization regulator
MYQAAQLRHRQHYGLATEEQFRQTQTEPSSIAMPFLYANTPAMGSKYSNTIVFYDRHRTRAHLLTQHLEEWQVEQLIQTGQKVLSESCDDPVVESDLMK